MDPGTPMYARDPADGAGSPLRRNAQPMPPPSPRPSNHTASTTSRAEMFEDEKRRITTSLFSKTDERGTLRESYITHIRIIEDGSHPAAPPPPDADPDKKKPRVIIVAVKSTGRVSMHKARENGDGSFQIGKTWPMEDLQSVENFSSLQASTSEEQTRAQWAGPTGFIVNMNKPYFWLAHTQKEKDFFVSSIIRIYRKFTQGKVPLLIGFTKPEQDQLLGIMAPPGARSPPPQQASRAAMSPPPSINTPLQRPSSAGSEADARSISVASTHTQQSQRPPSPPRSFQPFDRPSTRDRVMQPSSLQPRQAPPLRQQQSQDSGLRQMPSREMIRPGRFPGVAAQGPSPRLTPQSSRSNFVSATSNTSRLDPTSSIASSSAAGRSVESLPATSATREQWRPATSATIPDDRYRSAESVATETHARDLDAEPTMPIIAPPLSPPERRRPPLQDSVLNGERINSSVRPLLPRANRQESSESATLNEQRGPIPLRGPQTPLPDPFTTPSVKVEQKAVVDGSKIEENSSRDASVARSAIIQPDLQVSGAVDTTSADEKKADAAAIAAADFRPGLGPMTGRVEVANKFRKAASAVNAFKPRAGGAAERLLASKNKVTSGPDGITEVVPAPPKKIETPPPPEVATPPIPTPVEVEALPSPLRSVPAVEPAVLSQTEKKPELEILSTSREKQELRKSRSPTRPKKKRKSDLYSRSLTAMGIDPIIFDGKDVDFEDILEEFGLDEKSMQAKKLEVMELDLKREIGRLEAGSWLGNSDHRDERVDLVEQLLDRAIAECDEMEGLLTLYGVELGTLNDDITYIEAQSQGLQIQTANEKLLYTELQDLVKTISIDARQLDPLRLASLDDSRGLDQIESTLLLLYKALLTIDPASLHRGVNADPTIGLEDATSMTGMKALRERRDLYSAEATMFLHRLRNAVDPHFNQALMRTNDAIRHNVSIGKGPLQLDMANHDVSRNVLWKYSPLMLFAKEVEPDTWTSIMQAYQGRARHIYKDEFDACFEAYKRMAKNSAGEEEQAVFTKDDSQPTDTLTTAARKLTIKRSQTLARSFRSASFDKKSALERNRGGQEQPYDIVAQILQQTMPLMLAEQNFIVDFFHASSLESADFVELLQSGRPEDRQGGDLISQRVLDTDRSMTKRIYEAMQDIFSVLVICVGGFAILGTRAESIRRMDVDGTSQEFVSRTLQRLQDKLNIEMNRFVNEQIRAIEDTKVKIKKRRGVIAFIKTFPNFSIVIENMLESVHPAQQNPHHSPSSPRHSPAPSSHLNQQAPQGQAPLEIRTTIDEAYTRIIKAMFESLRVIARESPVSVNSGYGATADPEDKEALNYHILLIENMHHFYEEVEEHGNAVLGEWRGKAAIELANHQESYVNAVIRRPMGKLLDFIEGLDNTALAGRGMGGANAIANPSHSRSAFKKVLGQYDGKEVRRGIETLKKRVEKHFAEADDPANTQKLMGQILRECERRYVALLDRTTQVVTEVYEGSVEVEFGRTDITSQFGSR